MKSRRISLESYEPLSRKRKKKYVIKWRRFVIFLLLLALAGEVIATLLASPYFVIKEVRVTGNKTVSASSVISRLGVPKDTNIFRINKRVMVERLKKDPVIKDARIFRRFPNGIHVHVIEREADAVLDASGKFYLLDADGIPFRVVKKLDPKFTVISTTKVKKVSLGKCITVPEFKAEKECLKWARRRKLPRPTVIYIDQNDGLCLNTQDGFRVILGGTDKIPEKLGEAMRVIQEIPGFKETGDYVNVSCLGNPAYKLKGYNN